ncbi:MAG TPA: glycosyltransferase [Candidatus Solibacter sp.]|nr:glycosyltransferase [Candidatus Solibacter sp.]
MKPLITALIDTYNHERYIEQAIESVLAQDFPAEQMEVLVVDDGSSDHTAERVRKYGSRVQYFLKQNGGQGSAVNFGVQKAHGEFIILLDADDYWLPEKVRRVVERFEANPEVGMIHHRMRELDARTGELRDGHFLPLSGNLAATTEKILTFQPTSMSSLAFRKATLEKVLPIPEAVTIQADGYIQALAVFLAPVVAIDEPLAMYRYHGSNLYFLSEAKEDRDKDMERRKRRAVTLRALLNGMTDWFRLQGYDLAQQPVRATLSRWTTLLEREEFAIAPPGRIRFFRHLLASNRSHFGVMTRRLQLINYFNMMGSLVVGYKHFHRLDEWRETLTRRIHTRCGICSASPPHST